MKDFLRRIRGVVGTGITWAVGWGATFFGLSWAFDFGNFAGLGAAAISGMLFGFVAGGSFALILSLAERRRNLGQLSLKRIALWGGIGGATLLLMAAPLVVGLPVGVLISEYLVPLGIMGLLGAGFATGSVAIARHDEATVIEGTDDPLLIN